MNGAARAGLLVMPLALTGCGQSMDEQPKYETYSASAVFEDGASAQLPPADTVSQSAAAYAESEKQPANVDAALLERGHQRFDIYCAPCHGLDGYGDGMVVQRGFPAPPSFHSARLRAAPARHFYDVITKGYGAMYSYASRVPPSDRWAIIAFIRALQLSQDASPELARAAGVKLP